jgi:hypothetical protein
MKTSLLFCILAAAALGSARADVPQVGPAGAEEFVSGLPFYHPSIAADSKGQPHFVCDAGGNTQFMKFHRAGGQWRGKVFAVGSNGGKYNASRLYIGQIEIDGRDRAWISCKFGAKEYGEPGQGLWLFRDVATTADPAEQFFKFVSPHKGNGSISTDAKYPDQGVDLATEGNFVKLDDHGNVLDTGTINGGPSGEKIRFRIASYAPRFPANSNMAYPDGIWHTAMNGYSVFASAYQNSARYKAGLGPVNWAALGPYPQQSSDYSHPGVGIDLSDPRLCYMGCVFGGKLAVNIWDGKKMLFPSSALKILDYAAAYDMRHTIQFAPAPATFGGTFVIWSSGGRLKLCYLSKTGVAGAVKDLGAGSSPAACADRYGNLHLVYANNGIRYRKVPVQSLAPVAPAGRVSDTRSPAFRWASSKPNAAYTLEITQDGVVQNLVGVPTDFSNTWTSGADLEVGAYSWRVKQGASDSLSPWSASLAFSIPPDVPQAVAPEGRAADGPAVPVFGWSSVDATAGQFALQLFQGENLLGSLAVEGGGGPGFTADWTNALPVGSYAWRVKAARPLTGYTVSSDWTPLMAFQLGLPGLTVITNPLPSQVFGPGTTTVPCGWTPADGADSYDLKVLLNGKLFAFQNGLPEEAAELNDTFTPGYYSLLVRATNTWGKNPWSSPLTFIVERKMVPDGVVFSANPPREFKWTRSEPATKYLLKLAQLDKATGKYVANREAWVNQPASGAPRWTPPYTIPDGKFRWTITDFNGPAQGYTQAGLFQITNSGQTSWNDPALIRGKWKVVTEWRWREMTFQADGYIRSVQGDGTAFTRALWSADGEILTMISDVTEKCPYTVTTDTLTFALPSGNVKVLTRIP